jgi:MmyB-like transcription regulator ligand binding domain
MSGICCTWCSPIRTIVACCSIGKRWRARRSPCSAPIARYAGDPDFERLVARLTRLSPEFARWWPQREVARPLAGQKRIDHSIVGRMLFEYSSLGIGDPPDIKLIVFTPLEEEGTVRKLERLLRDRPIRRQEARLSA